MTELECPKHGPLREGLEACDQCERSPVPVQSDELEAVEYAALAIGHAHDQLAATIRAAHREGSSLRKIAEAAGVSHEQVRRLIHADQA